MMKKILAIMMTMVACFTGCAAAGPRPPIRLPFAVHQTGATVSSEVRIVKNGAYRYPFFLIFPFKDNEERERVRKLVGGPGRYKNGQFAEPGIPINLKITISIIEPSGERILSEQEVFTVGIEATDVHCFIREIEQHKFRMSPGLYRVTVENLKGIPEFADIKVVFVIYTLRKV
jgi:hypothetical protein